MKTLADFVLNKSPLQRGRILKTLGKKRMIEGFLQASYGHIEDFISKGWVVNEARNILGEKKEGLVIGIIINKSERDYAEYIIKNLVWDSIVS